MNRLPLISLVVIVSLSPEQLPAESVHVNADSAIAYLLNCRKANGAFGPLDQEYTDAAWNYPAVAALGRLGHRIADPERVVANGLGYPKGHVGYGHWQFFHFHGARALLERPIETRVGRVTIQHQGDTPRYYGSPFGTDGKTFFSAGHGSAGDARDKDANTLGFYNLSSLYYLVAGLNASGRAVANPDEAAAFIKRRQAPGGGFADVRTESGAATDGDAHVAHTFHALATLNLLNAKVPRADECVKFLHACERPDGSVLWNPQAGLSGNKPDVYYTWAAVRALALLRQSPGNPGAVTRWINLLQNADGGFGDRPGWRSRIYSTYYAVEALSAIAGSARSGISEKTVAPIPGGTTDLNGYRIFQGLNKVPVVTESDLAGLRKRGLNLLGIKSGDFSLPESLNPVIRQRNPDMMALLCPEAYPHRARALGGLLLDHTANVMLDPDWSAAQRSIWLAADSAGATGLAWPAYQEQVIRPARELGALIYPEQDFEMEHAYRAYDEGTPERPGYNAVLAGFNWTPRDFVRVFPWRERHMDKLTPIADADAHGDLRKWSPQLDHVRHLFIAREPTYAAFREAANEGRVVCVIHSPEGVPSGVSYYGPPVAVEFVKRRVKEWRWW